MTGADVTAERVEAASDLRAMSMAASTRAAHSPRSWEKGDWMQTYTGRKFYPMDPDPDDIDEADIAHALSLLCRFNGHVDRFYSVAEHCVLMASVMPTRELALWALLHDATEAYVGDMIRPLKRNMPDYERAEMRVMVAIAEKFHLAGDLRIDGLGRIYPELPPEVKEADNRILLTERAALMSHPPGKWAVDGLEPLPVTISGWDPKYAEGAYRARLHELLTDCPVIWPQTEGRLP